MKCFVLMITWNVCMAGLHDIAKVRNLYIETEKRILVNTNYYLNEEQSSTYDVNLGLDIDLPLSFYYDSKVVSTTDQSQFRFVGLNFEFGFEPVDNLQVYYRHFSGHALDDKFQRNFPQDNSIGIRFNLIGNKR